MKLWEGVMGERLETAVELRGAACPARAIEHGLLWVRRLPSEPAAVDATLGDLQYFLLQHAVRRDEVESLELSAREALANAMVHGNGSDPSKPILLCLTVYPEEVVLAVTDQGRGFDPEEIADPRRDDRLLGSHGRGIFLMRQLVEDVSYQARGTRVVLTKRRRTRE